MNRFSHTVRDYDLESITHLKPRHQSKYAGEAIASKLYEDCRKAFEEKRKLISFGILDPVQVVEAAPHLDVIYVSGWQSSSTASSNNLQGPDIADYPYDTVPKKVEQLFKAQQLHDVRVRLDDETNTIHRPIIADADTGHGGMTSVMKMTHMFIEAGASGIHLEDQKHGTKKCGHMGGKVLVSTYEHIQRLKAARLQADLMEYPLFIVSRTDAEAAKLIDNNHDERDQPFLLGATTIDGKSVGELTIPEAVAAFGSNDTTVRTLVQMEAFMKSNPSLEWSAEKLRTIEGYYKVKCGIEFSAMRAVEYSAYADMIWMETAKPVLNDAKHFASLVHGKAPHTMLGYNLSPSFNWDSTFKEDGDIRTFMDQLGDLGFVWQFITLAGFHLNGLGTHRFAKGYREEGMLAYVRDIQREERKEGITLLTHQKWSGAYVVDQKVTAITTNSSTNIMSNENTESQF